ncbi:SAM-dependent methyltransferase [Actinokineospora sp. G85]|uniref:SAM-dependent methyltransferase n=1 Tax=Actinokineospora sp. G85 TaxID=3406626 RepID=UPI003C74B173
MSDNSEHSSGPAPAIDPDRPHPARIYDYLLGGACNFAPDREFADRFIAAVPEAKTAALLNRDFLRRAVRESRAAGITQFLDLGSGIPAVGNVHDTVPDARVVYVDNDPIAVAHSEIVLGDSDRAVALLANMLDTEAVLGAPATRELIDFEQPVAVLMVAILHFVAEPQEAVRRYIEVMAPGSVLVISHGTGEAELPGTDRVVELYAETGTPGVDRGKADLLALVEGLEVLEPGVVWTPQWRPDTEPDGRDPRESMAYALVARKP